MWREGSVGEMEEFTVARKEGDCRRKGHAQCGTDIGGKEGGFMPRESLGTGVGIHWTEVFLHGSRSPHIDSRRHISGRAGVEGTHGNNRGFVKVPSV